MPGVPGGDSHPCLMLKPVLCVSGSMFLCLFVLEHMALFVLAMCFLLFPVTTTLVSSMFWINSEIVVFRDSVNNSVI